MIDELALDDPTAVGTGRCRWTTSPGVEERLHRPGDVHPRPDVLVVGAGVAGLATAATLVERGVGVVQVVDRGPVAGGATGRNAGALIPDVHALVVDDAEAALGRRGLALHRAAAPRLGYPLRELRWLAVTDTPPPADRLASSGATWLPDRRAVTEAAGEHVAAARGVLVPGQAAIDPVAFALALAEALPHLATGVDVGRVHHRDGLVVQTSAGTVRPGAVVLATGAVPSRWLSTSRRWVTGHLAATAPLPDLPRHLAVARDVVVVPDGDGRLLVGGTRDGERLDGRVEEAVVDRIRAELESLVPAARGVPFEQVWTGQRPVVDDDLPVVDEVADDVLVVGGLFHTGVLSCLAVAEGVAERLLGGVWPSWVAPFHRR